MKNDKGLYNYIKIVGCEVKGHAKTNMEDEKPKEIINRCEIFGER